MHERSCLTWLNASLAVSNMGARLAPCMQQNKRLSFRDSLEDPCRWYSPEALDVGSPTFPRGSRRVLERTKRRKGGCCIPPYASYPALRSELDLTPFNSPEQSRGEAKTLEFSVPRLWGGGRLPALGMGAESPQRACERGDVTDSPTPCSGGTPKSVSGFFARRSPSIRIQFLRASDRLPHPHAVP